MPKAKAVTTKKTSRKTTTSTADVKISRPKSTKKITSKSESNFEVLDNKQTSNYSQFMPKMTRKWAYIGVGVLVLITAAVWVSKYMAVAWVDNKPVTRIEFYQELEKQYGKQVKQQLVVEKLIVSEATKRGVTVNDQEINDEIKKLEDQRGGADKLNEALTMSGITRDQLVKAVKLQLLKQKMFSNGVNISDQEITNYITENEEALKVQYASVSGKLSENATVKKEVMEELKNRRVDTDFSNWLEEALKSSRVFGL